MRKKFIIINGSMGTGKTTVCKSLYSKFNNSVWLDGDWCWLMHPWNITEKNKLMVINNIRFILKSYLANSSFDYVFFTWVIPQEDTFNLILDSLKEFEFDLYKITLLCSKEALLQRMIKDNREEYNINNSIKRLECYEKMDTIKVDTTDKSVEEIVQNIENIISKEYVKTC
ncbi:MAG: nucleotide kinase [Clostridium sp.]|nr:nucleotide kinase [Clostridium sp.]